MARSRVAKAPRSWHCEGRLTVAPRHEAIRDRLILTCPGKHCGAGLAGQVQLVLYPDSQGGLSQNHRPSLTPDQMSEMSGDARACPN